MTGRRKKFYWSDAKFYLSKQSDLIQGILQREETGVHTSFSTPWTLTHAEGNLAEEWKGPR